MPNSPDDLAALEAERAAADREYNDALTRLDRAIQQLPTDFPQPPPPLDEHQITPLNTLWKIDLPAATGWRRGFVAGVRRAVAPLFAQQQAFNSAVVDHVNRNVAVARETRASIDSTLTVLGDTIGELVRFQSLLVMFLQQIMLLRRHARSRRRRPVARAVGRDQRGRRQRQLLKRRRPAIAGTSCASRIWRRSCGAAGADARRSARSTRPLPRRLEGGSKRHAAFDSTGYHQRLRGTEFRSARYQDATTRSHRPASADEWRTNDRTQAFAINPLAFRSFVTAVPPQRGGDDALAALSLGVSVVKKPSACALATTFAR